MPVAKVVSGGQTGADRAALDAAASLGLETGGWVPRGRRAEDGAVPARYAGLVETESDDYATRTAWNVRDSDATLVFAFGAPGGGTALTRKLADTTGKPCLVLDLERSSPAESVATVRRWLVQTRPRTLNGAGPRASEEPRVGAAVRAVLHAALVD